MTNQDPKGPSWFDLLVFSDLYLSNIFILGLTLLLGLIHNGGENGG